MATCSIEGCEDEVLARGWCGLHYRRWKRYGDPLACGFRDPASKKIAALSDADLPVADRTVSSRAIFKQRVRAVEEAWDARDEAALRYELRALDDELGLLNGMPALVCTTITRHQAVYADASMGPVR